jgi:hypothetical protein
MCDATVASLNKVSEVGYDESNETVVTSYTQRTQRFPSLVPNANLTIRQKATWEEVKEDTHVLYRYVARAPLETLELDFVNNEEGDDDEDEENELDVNKPDVNNPKRSLTSTAARALSASPTNIPTAHPGKK